MMVDAAAVAVPSDAPFARFPENLSGSMSNVLQAAPVAAGFHKHGTGAVVNICVNNVGKPGACWPCEADVNLIRRKAGAGGRYASRFSRDAAFQQREDARRRLAAP